MAHGAVECPPEPHRIGDGSFVHHRQRAGKSEARRAHVGVGFGAELVGAPAEQLGGRRQLDMDLEPTHEFPLVGQ